MKEKEKVKQEPIPVEPEVLPPVPVTRRPPTLAPRPDAPASEWSTNFNLTTDEGKAGILNASNPPDWRPQDGGEFFILATHFVVLPDEVMDDETGELKQVTSTVLIDKDGRKARFSSDFAPRRLHAMLSLYSSEQWAKGIRIRCFSKPSRFKGRVYGSFEVVPEKKP